MASRKLRKMSLAKSHPEIAKQFHPTKNNGISPDTISGSHIEPIVWICEKGHERTLTPRARTKNPSELCSKCISLYYTHPEIAQQWHPSKNGLLTAFDVTSGSNEMVWWHCSLGPDHEWTQTVKTRVMALKKNKSKESQCQVCAKRIAVPSNCLLSTHPKIAAEWDYELNESLEINPTTITEISRTVVHWKCVNNHKWKTPIRDRTQKNTQCIRCIGRRATPENSLVVTHPEIAAQWNATKNGTKNPDQFTKGSDVKIWWQCSKVENHVWEAYIYSRTAGRGCPYCNYRSVESIRLSILSLIPYLDTFEPVELYVLFQQNGLLDSIGKSRSFIKNFVSGKFPKKEIEEIVNDELKFNEFVESQEALFSDINELQTISELALDTQEKDFRMVETKDILSSIDPKIKVYASADAETIEFLVKQEVAKIWRHAFKDEQQVQLQLKRYKDKGVYANEVKKLFSEGYEGAKSLQIPIGYNPNPPAFIPKAKDIGLMQLYVAYQVKKTKRFGNWSGTGAGKTLSAILASRVIEAKITIICCPNNVIDTWKKLIQGAYPNSIIYTKETMKRLPVKDNEYKYLILNYDFFRNTSESKLKWLVENYNIDFIVIDEIHQAKQRYLNDVSQKKSVISAFLSEVSNKNPRISVLGMSATPVVNELLEGKTVIEHITGLNHDELDTRTSIPNCIALFKKFVSNGIRYMPNYNINLNQKIEKIDCSNWISDIRNHRTNLELEGILTRAKLPFILEQLRAKTIVYTHYRGGIELILYEAIMQKGWTVAWFNGETKTGLEQFVKGEADILIASSCIGTGIDGLQEVCSQLIINCLPWTHADFKQLIGRIYRQGQKKESVDIIIPLTFAYVNGEYWSWCESRWKRIEFKKSISDSAVDGVIPEGHLRSPAQAHKDIMEWFKRLDQKGIHELEQNPIVLQLNEDPSQTTLRKIANITKMNQQINKKTSQETYKRFTNNPNQWHEYHKVYGEIRNEWKIIPYQEAIKWCKARPHLVIGDFGCGEAFLAQEHPNIVYSFDHIAINDKVISCDISHVPLNDSALGAAIFSLSLMGTNFVDYLKEAKRCLQLDGHLWIAEPTARIKDINLLTDLLSRLGFDVYHTSQKDKFTFIKAIKTERTVNEIMLQDLISMEILD